jgi:hypothetical protein
MHKVPAHKGIHVALNPRVIDLKGKRKLSGYGVHDRPPIANQRLVTHKASWHIARVALGA